MLSRASLLPPGPLFRGASPRSKRGDSGPRTEVRIPEQEYLDFRMLERAAEWPQSSVRARKRDLVFHIYDDGRREVEKKNKEYSKTSLIAYLTYCITSLIAYKIRLPTSFPAKNNQI